LSFSLEQVVRKIIPIDWINKLSSSRAKRLSKEFFWIGLGQAIAVLGALVGIRILTGVLEPQIYGQLALGMTITTLVNQVVFGPIGNSATRFFASSREANTLHDYLAALGNIVYKATGCIILVVFIVCFGLVLAGQGRWIGLIITAICFAILSGYNSILDGMQNAARQRSIVALHQGLLSWGRFLLAAGMVLWLGHNTTVAMAGYGLATIFVLVSQGFFFRRTIGTREITLNKDDESQCRWSRQILSYAWPFAVWGVPAWLQLASERWSLKIFSSTTEVGMYAVLYQLGYYPITLMATLVVQLIAPVMFQRAGDASDPSRIKQVYILNKRLSIIMLLLTGIAVLFTFGLHDFIFKLLVAPEYRMVSWLLPGMILAGGLFATAQFAAVALLSGTQTRLLIIPKVAIAVLGVSLNLIGAAFWGVTGIVYANVTITSIYLVWILLLVKAQHNKSCNQYVEV
jgi:O-antigen/teichoic acid export membrane protein